MSSSDRPTSAPGGSSTPSAGPSGHGDPGHEARSGANPATIGLLTTGRFTTNVAYRMVYPFLAVVAHGLGCSVATVGLVLSLRECTGVLVPAATRRMEHLGYRTAMLLCLLTIGAAAAVAAAPGPGTYAFALGMILIGLAKACFDSAMGGWIGDRVPFAARGRVTGLTEISWSLALLVGMPLVALAFDAWGVRSGFLGVAALNLLAALVLRRWVPPHHPRHGGHARLDRLPRSHATVALFGGMALMAGAMQLVIVVHGVWLQDHFGMSTAGLGLSSMVLGVAELAGAGATVLWTDRVGKARTMLAGLVPMAAAVLLLGRATPTAGAALALLALAVVGFEIAFISALPMLSELNPAARAATLGRAFLWLTLARGAATLVGTRLYEHSGMAAVGTLSGVAALAAAACVRWGVSEP